MASVKDFVRHPVVTVSELGQIRRLRRLPFEEIETNGTQKTILRSILSAEYNRGRSGTSNIYDIRGRMIGITRAAPSHEEVLGEAYKLQRLDLIKVSDAGVVRFTERGRAFAQLRRLR